MSYCEMFCSFNPAHCRARKVQLVSDERLDSPLYRFHLRSFLRHCRIPPMAALNFYSDALRDSDCVRVFEGDREIELNTGLLEFPTFPWWYRDLCRPGSFGIQRINNRRREELRILATLVTIIFPVEAARFGSEGLHYEAGECAGTIH